MTYRPLPNSLTIKSSSIEGLGLFTEQELKKGTELGVSHVEDSKFEDSYIRTPLGGFVNHSLDPNCEFYKEDQYIKLRTIKKLKTGTELTAEYWLYNIKEKSK